jgi:phage terminase large subunit-like protein
VRRACQRHLDDLKRARRKDFAFRFDPEKANKAIRFIEALPHIKGEFAGQRLILSDWQCFVTGAVFGWVHKKTGLRRFRTVYIEVPRKNGKSSWSAGIALYMLCADGEEGAEVYSAATVRDQARIVWDTAKRMVERTPALRRALGVAAGAHAIFVDRTASTFRALSREHQGNLDGLNVHCAIIDELHAHKDRGIWDVIETATGARSQSLVWAITTAGFNRSGICYEQRAYLCKVLDGKAKDETFFGVIYSIDSGLRGRKDDDWTNPQIWRKANPNWGISVKPDDIERKARKAMQVASATNNFLTKHLDVWVNADTAWMSMRAWDKCADEDLQLESFAGMDCIVALDLATKTDLAAKVFLFWRDLEEQEGKFARHYYLFGRFYLPEEAIEDGRNSQYPGWAETGTISTTPGNVTDFDVIEEEVRADAAKFHIIACAFDPWQASQMSQHLLQDGLPMLEYRQTVQNMSEPMKELEKVVLQGRLHHTGDEALAWMMSNVVCHTDAKENIYPRKEMPENKIDGAVAAIMAFGASIAAKDPSIGHDYELMTL